jgi:hypothetical protein
MIFFLSKGDKKEEASDNESGIAEDLIIDEPEEEFKPVKRLKIDEENNPVQRPAWLGEFTNWSKFIQAYAHDIQNGEIKEEKTGITAVSIFDEEFYGCSI